MGVLQTSKNMALLDGDSRNVQARGNQKGKDTKNTNQKPKDNKKYSNGASSSNISKNKFETDKCSYRMIGFHPERECMDKSIHELSNILEQNNISLPQSTRRSEEVQKKEGHKRCHALKEGFTQ